MGVRAGRWSLPRIWFPSFTKGSKVTALTPAQANDSLAALERLETLRLATGRRISLLGAVSEFAAAVAKLDGNLTLGDAIERWQNTVAAVKRKDLAEAVEEFI
jgi:hypothetical protein